jgi:hypothetical protein
MTPDEYETRLTRLRAGFVALVGASGALVALANGGGPALAGVALAAGLVLGAAMVWYLGAILPTSG